VVLKKISLPKILKKKRMNNAEIRKEVKGVPPLAQIETSND
jgi:hypothetical protein